MSKPKMPEGGITVTVDGLTAKLDSDPEKFSNGSMRWKITDCVAQVFNGDKQIGSIGGCIGGGLFAEIGGRSWHIAADELWKVIERIDAAYAGGKS